MISSKKVGGGRQTDHGSILLPVRQSRMMNFQEEQQDLYPYDEFPGQQQDLYWPGPVDFGDIHIV